MYQKLEIKGLKKIKNYKKCHEKTNISPFDPKLFSGAHSWEFNRSLHITDQPTKQSANQPIKGEIVIL